MLSLGLVLSKIRSIYMYNYALTITYRHNFADREVGAEDGVQQIERVRSMDLALFPT